MTAPDRYGARATEHAGAPASRSRTPLLFWLVLVLTVGQLVVATFATGLPQFEGKAFGSRLAAYPLLMLATPAIWWLVAGRHGRRPVPWGAFTLIALPFLVDVTGNSLDLYDAVVWWDDLNHLVNWFFLTLGLGLLLDRETLPRGVLVLAVTGLGAILAIGWELAEWFTFIRHGTELDTAYTDTLGDEALGTLGAFAAALVLLRLRPSRGE